jgi:CubicO group peptidase (beta-lactamase class C family)
MMIDSKRQLLAFFVLAVAGCAQVAPSGSNVSDGWATAQPADEGLDSVVLSEAVTFIEQDEHEDFRSLVVARNGKLVAEHYFNGHGPDSLQDMRSAGKSVTSALVGIAIADGDIPSIDTAVLSLFPTYQPVAHDGIDKQSITILHLLTMTSGLDADADDRSSPGYEDRMWETDDWVRFVLDLPMASSPGTAWTYSSASAFLAGAAVEEAVGQSLAGFAEDRLFDPLGIDNYRWLQAPSGRTVGQGNLSLRARDHSVPWSDYDGYGYSWYTHVLQVEGRDFGYFFASGNGGNKIYVFPEEQIVVVIQSAAYNTSYGQRRSLEVLKRVLAAVAR